MYLNSCCDLFRSGSFHNIMLEWRNWLHEEFEELSRFMLPTDDTTLRYPGTDASYGREVMVMQDDDGRFIGYIEDRPCRIELEISDVLIYRFDLWRFRKETSECLGLTPQRGEIERWDHTVPWGNWEPEKGTSYPVTAFFGADYLHSFRERVMERAIQRQAVGEIIITSNRRDWHDNIAEIARKNKLLLVPLNEIVQIENGKFLPTPEWNEYLTAFCKMVECDLPSRFQKKSNGYVFAKRGSWFFHFGEKETIIDSDFQGASFVYHLLQYPHQKFHVEKLWFEVMAQTCERTISMAHVEHSFADEDVDMPNSLLGGADEMIDAEARREYEARLKELAQERREAESNKDAATLDAINKEFEFIQRILLTSGSKKHGPKKLGDTEVQLYDRIRKAILATIKQIEKNDPEGASYLKNTIKTGKFMVYSPSQPIEWKFS